MYFFVSLYLSIHVLFQFLLLSFFCPFGLYPFLIRHPMLSLYPKFLFPAFLHSFLPPTIPYVFLHLSLSFYTCFISLSIFMSLFLLLLSFYPSVVLHLILSIHVSFSVPFSTLFLSPQSFFPCVFLHRILSFYISFLSHSLFMFLLYDLCPSLHDSFPIPYLVLVWFLLSSFLMCSVLSFFLSIQISFSVPVCVRS